MIPTGWDDCPNIQRPPRRQRDMAARHIDSGLQSLSCADVPTEAGSDVQQLIGRGPHPAMGEAVRLALAQSGVEWEDNRIKLQDWTALKPTTPYGQLPLMEVDGRVIPQSYAQLRYVGKIGDLYPTDPIQAAYCDAAADAVLDIHTPMRASLSEKDKEKKMEMRKDLAENLIPTWLANVEKVLESAGGKHFAGGKLSIGDIAIVARLNWLKAGVLDGIPSTIVDGSPLLSSLVERVMAEPRIAAYMETRPKK